jgi:hypothetical protein
MHALSIIALFIGLSHKGTYKTPLSLFADFTENKNITSRKTLNSSVLTVATIMNAPCTMGTTG